MLKAVIFDLDGTLLDTSRDICLILNRSLEHFNLPQVTLTDTLSMVGDGAYKLIERAVPRDKSSLVRDVYNYYIPSFERCENSLTCLYEGEDEALFALRDRCIKTAVLTNKPQAAADAVCAAKLSRFCFDMIVGQTNRFALKPDPSSAFYIMRSLKVEPEECLFVGDGEADVLTAKNAGIACISALWGFRKREKLAEAGAKIFARNFNEFLHLLQKKFL